ncbi:hypothetical protein BHE74_00045149, partial [Ensete ventricosum]
LERDVGRLVDCKDRMNFCPLGACALAGTGLPIDRFLTSDALGFTAPMRNRTSHEIVGRCVALCVTRNCQLSELPLDQLQGINSIFKEDVYDFLGVENSVDKFSSYGSTGSECVAEQLNFWISKLQIDQTENEKTE